ncbi:AI-2E family transporter [Ancylobacter mangrovi]|uniref:AI-2E family transporter n=1 Tax=Ancylobacter mangrovi TaxID=2972472 RepID=UPI0021636C03|nr:AI-2E family transporter [Ancylobacter mangrovi]MCS0503199.1 AI-2E family transporter [Ancylobacter mangrovi]
MSVRATSILLGICAAVLAGGACYFARSLIAPVAFALFVIALVWPLQARLQARMAKLPAMAISLSVTILVIGALGYATVWGLSQTGRWLIVNAARFQAIYTETTTWLEGHGLYSAGMLADTFNVGWLIGMFQGLAGRLNAMLGFAVVTLVYVMLGLLEVDIMRAKLAGEAGEAGRRLLRASAAVAAKFRTYMMVRTVMSVLTGLFVWAVTAALGLDLAPAFGVIAFALNYIPFIGPLVATLLPTFFSLAQFGSWETAVLVFVAMNVIQFFSGSYIEPRVAGRALAMSPFLVLLSVFFWSFMWGMAGAFIGVPLVIAALTFCEEGEETRWIARLLSGREEPPADAVAGPL